MISIHALLAESDHAPSHSLYLRNNFYPRSPCGERQVSNQCKIDQKNFYPRSPCGERLRQRRIELGKFRFLSTLSLRRATNADTKNTSFHKLFLSTLSLRRATSWYACSMAHTANFYPRSPCGERRLSFCFSHAYCSISIHALLAESDKGEFEMTKEFMVFLSTLSLRRATR